MELSFFRSFFVVMDGLGMLMETRWLQVYIKLCR
jgi:hypothetical protein